MKDTPTPSAEEMMKKLSFVFPVPKTIRCEGKNGAVAYAPNPEYPPFKGGGCEAEDYAMWLYEDVKPFIEQMFKDCCVMREALEKAKTLVPDRTVDCRGDKCRKPDCEACFRSAHEYVRDAACAFIDEVLSQVSQYPKPE